MRNLIRALVLMPAMALTACGGGDSPGTETASARLGQEFVLGFGETVDVGPLSLEFTSVVEDQRCPVGTSVMCVWSGNARILVSATDGAHSQVLTLNTASDFGSMVIFANHVIELRRLDPWPTSLTPPADFNSYTATLYVDGWMTTAGN